MKWNPLIIILFLVFYVHSFPNQHQTIKKRGFISRIGTNQVALRNHGIYETNIEGDLPILPKIQQLHDNRESSHSSDTIIPNGIPIGQKIFKISRFIATGEQGKVFEGYDSSDASKEPVIIKLYHPDIEWSDLAFDNEERALRKLGRLVESDRKKLILVSKKIQGPSLHDTVNFLISKEEWEKCAKLLDKYLDLLPSFREKYRLVHGDGHPDNVIVDQNGDLQLIDFGYTAKLSKSESVAEQQIAKDDVIAVNWIDYYLARFSNNNDLLN